MNNARTHSAVQPGVALPAWGNQSSDRLSYDGVGRMIAKRYLTGGINGATHAYNNTTALVGATTGYDRAGNKLYERHLEAESRSHLYQPFNVDGSFGVGYDSANRLRQYQRGVLSSTIIPYLVAPGASVLTPTTLPGADQVRSYGLDGLGNWKNTNFSQVGSEGDHITTAEMRQHNYVNEITQRRDTTGRTPTITPFVYDRNGNLLNDGVRTYLYDAFNRLIQVGDVSTGAVISTYVYDAFNRRTQKTINYLGGGDGGLTGDIPAGVTDYLYDGLQIVEERNDAFPTAWTKINFWGQYIDELMFFAVPTESAPTTYRVLSDLLYRTVAIVTTDNVITEAYDTDAYGNTLCYSGPGTDGLWFTNDDVRTNNPINSTIFTGRQYDPESQIYYYRARYYAPQWGRFISRDPIGAAGGINLYAYVRNNSPKWTDPKGLDGSVDDTDDTSDNSASSGAVATSSPNPSGSGGQNTGPNYRQMAIGELQVLGAIGSIVGGAALTAGSGGLLFGIGVIAIMEGVPAFGLGLANIIGGLYGSNDTVPSGILGILGEGSGDPSWEKAGSTADDVLGIFDTRPSGMLINAASDYVNQQFLNPTTQDNTNTNTSNSDTNATPTPASLNIHLDYYLKAPTCK